MRRPNPDFSENEKILQDPLEQKLHTKARAERPKEYPERFPVPDDKVSWETDYPEYQPPYYVDPKILDKTKAKQGRWDPEDINRVSHPYTSYEGQVRFDSNGRPLNPRGRTGIAGRGNRWLWGPNHAADPIITRFDPHTGVLEMLAIERTDSGEWAIPGGHVEPGEGVSETLKREFKEEAGIELDMEDAIEIYKGYVDDPRNTDNAWMETDVRHKHLPTELASAMEPTAGSDAASAQWLELTPDTIHRLFASHGEFVLKTLKHWLQRDDPNFDPDKRTQLEHLIESLRTSKTKI